MKIIYALATLFVLTGCVAVWGAPYEVRSESASSINMRYDGHFTNLAKVQGAAQKHCDQYNKVASVATQHKSIWGLTTITFTCQNKPQ